MMHCFQTKSFPFFEKLCKEIFHSCMNQLPPRCAPLAYDQTIHNPPGWVRKGDLSLWNRDFECIRSSVYLREDGYLWESGGVSPNRMDPEPNWVVLPATPSTFLARAESLKETKLIDVPESPKLPLGYQGLIVSDDSPLRPAQREAVRKADAPLSFIWGPPGTGKTFTIVKAVEAILAADRDNKVFVTATADKAVQAVVDGLLGLHLDRRLQQFKDDVAPEDVPHRKVDFFSAKARGCEDKKTRDHYLALASNLRSRAQVLCANSLSVAAKALRQQLPFITHLIIDEASMMPMWMVSILVHFLLGKESLKIVLVGDPKQLPCVISSEEVKKDQMGMNPYQYFGVGNANLSTPENVVTFLDLTSRMPSRLTRAVSSTFYGGALQPLRNPADFNGLFGDPREQQVGYWNGGATPWAQLIGQFDPIAPKPPKYNKNTSMDEACEVTKLAWLCQQKNRKCLILTPYNNQVYLINSWLTKNNVTCAQATTVHKAQGQEADIVIWSVVADMASRGASYFNRLNNPIARSLANVALSRAKHQVFIIGADPSQPTVAGEFLANWESAAQGVPSVSQPQALVEQQVVQAKPQQVAPQVQVAQESPRTVEQVEEPEPISAYVKRCHYFGDWFDWNGLDDHILSELQQNGVCTQKKNDRWTEPRLTAWFSEDNVAYEYSGIRHESQGWPDWVERLAQGIKGQYGDRYHKPNSVLVNVYRNGGDYVSMHKDDEPLFDENQPIASVSLGATRAFCIGTDRTIVDHTIDLEDKSLLLMLPGFQNKYWHGVPRQPDVEYARVNLTFRYVKPQEKQPAPTTLQSQPKMITFSKTKEPYGEFGNMASGYSIKVQDGPVWPSSEHLYQACKFQDESIRQQILAEKNAYLMKKDIARPNQDKVRADWDQIKDSVMQWCVSLKLVQNSSVLQTLRDTGDAIILEYSTKDHYWGASKVNNEWQGQNKLGELLVYLRNNRDALTSIASQRPHPAYCDVASEAPTNPAPTENTLEVISQPEVPAPTDTSGELDPKFKEWLESTGRIDKYLDGPGYRKDHMKRVYKLILKKNNK